MTNEENLELLYLDRPVMRPTARTWAKHILLLADHVLHGDDRGVDLPIWPDDAAPGR